jgi:uncharacterized membrane protein
MKSVVNKDLLKAYNGYLHIGVDLIEIIVYLLVIMAIFRSFILIILTFIDKGKNNENKVELNNDQYTEVKLILNNTISICLSGIVFVEIMKLFYIKTFKQLGLVAGVIVIKLFLLFFISQERNKEVDRINYFN